MSMTPGAETWQTKTRENDKASDPLELLHQGLELIEGPVSLASSFSMEDIVLIDLLQKIDRPIGIFAIDTGRLNEETLKIAETIRLRYALEIDWYFPDRGAIENLEREKGLFSFRASLENRHQCCHIRKIEPLQRALKDLSGWVTGQRREQAATRNMLLPIEVDQTNGGLIKLNPLTFWTEKEVRDYIRKHHLPINRLHGMGYPSIGCAPCTRPIQPGDDTRAGRWWWERPEHKECGLHNR